MKLWFHIQEVSDKNHLKFNTYNEQVVGNSNTGSKLNSLSISITLEKLLNGK